MRRTLVRAGMVAVALALATGMVYTGMAFLGIAGNDLDREIALARKAGMWLSYEQAAREEPASGNAAPAYQALWPRFSAVSPTWETYRRREDRAKWDAASNEAFRKSVASQAPLLRDFAEASRQPQLVVATDPRQAHEFAWGLFVVAWVLTERARDRIAAKDAEGALTDLEAAARIADHLAQRPDWRGASTRDRITRDLVHRLEELLAVDSSIRSVRRSKALLESIRPMNLRGVLCDELYNARSNLRERLLGQSMGHDDPFWKRQPAFVDAVDAILVRRYREAFEAAPTQPSVAVVRRLYHQPRNVEASDAASAMAVKFFPMGGHLLGLHTEAETKRLVALTAIDLILEQQRLGRFPADPKLPEDPVTGNSPMKLMRQGAGFVVYSVGGDLIDQGGEPGNQQKGDLVFRYQTQPNTRKVAAPRADGRRPMR